MEARKAGFEAGVMRRMPAHPYIIGTTPAREFMEGFKSGRERRAWLDARGMKRVRQIIDKAEGGGWWWEVLVENTIAAKGWAKSHKAASRQAEDAALATRNC